MEKSNKMTVFSCVTMSIGAIIGAGLFSSLPLGISMVGSNVGWAFVLGAVFIIIRTVPSLLLGILFYYPCLAFLKRYPNAAKRSYLRIPTPVQVVLCLFSMGISFYMGMSLLTSLDSRLAATMIGFYVVGYGYYFLGYRYMKQHGLDIIAEGKKEPASWVERNRPLEEIVSAK